MGFEPTILESFADREHAIPWQIKTMDWLHWIAIAAWAWGDPRPNGKRSTSPFSYQMPMPPASCDSVAPSIGGQNKDGAFPNIRKGPRESKNNTSRRQFVVLLLFTRH